MDEPILPEPFEIRVDESVLGDLADRLRRTRFPEPTPAESWHAGIDVSYLKELVTYWADGFDWREQERRLNAWPQYKVSLDGVRTHFVHVRSGRDGALPLVLAHGWPSLFTEYLPLAEKLKDRFDLVIPSLPGFGYAEAPAEPLTRKWIAEHWHRLMTDVLGYERYGVVGGDIGGDVVHWMAGLHPDSVAGLHTIHPKVSTDGGPLSEAEEAYVRQRDIDEEALDGGYSHVQATRPDTLAAALIDSPSGLAAWILDKFDSWGDGRIYEAFDRDELLTLLTLYWSTGCIGSSLRTYYDYPKNPPRPRIAVPAAVTLSAEDLWVAGPSSVGYPRELANRSYDDLRSWHEPGSGGHFFALEQTTLFATDIRAFFTSLEPTN
ncbi:epoxide hydrolase family protein [Kribbella monticola]|uniref:epoxide hydrolase family protein n=1 Tax=Kribbella monticola TaxID=2185285 RepID=UPI0018E57A29|nr:epoxide hydrolase family protein [Kribbella monticola]